MGPIFQEEIRRRFGLDLQQSISLWHSGADLSPTWILQDVGIPYGASLHCTLKEQEPIPDLHIQCNYNGQRIDLYDANVIHLTIFELQETVMRRTGLPLGSFRLTDASGRELFARHSCSHYGVLPGATVFVQVWKGWSDLINVTIEGNIAAVHEAFDKDKVIKFYQMKVVTFIAAHYGLLELAEEMLTGGVRADEPVGYHPGKQWCSDRADPTLHLYAVHRAVAENKLELLRLFMSRFPASIIVQNYKCQDALAIAQRHGNSECVTHINTKQSKPTVIVPNLVGQKEDETFLYRNYCLAAKIKQWQGTGRDKVALFTKRSPDGSLNLKTLETRRSQVLPTKSDKAMHVDGLIHFRSRTCPANFAERPLSSLSDRRPMGSGRTWTPSAKTRQMKKAVISQGLHWDISRRSSGKVEFADLLFTPRKQQGTATTAALPTLPSASEEGAAQQGTGTTKQSGSAAAESSVSVRSSGRSMSGLQPRQNKRTIQAIEDPSTGLWVHNGLTAREKATACLDMSSSYSRKSWMSKFRIAMSVNESTLKRKLKEDSPRIPVTRNEQGRLYRKQYQRLKPRVKANNFAADWVNCVESREAKSQSESRAFRRRGSMIVHEKLSQSTILSK